MCPYIFAIIPSGQRIAVAAAAAAVRPRRSRLAAFRPQSSSLLLPPRLLERRRVQNEQRVLLLLDPEQQPIDQRDDGALADQRLERGVQLVAGGQPAQHHLAVGLLEHQLHRPTGVVDAMVHAIVEALQSRELPAVRLVVRCGDVGAQQLRVRLGLVQEVAHLRDADGAQIDGARHGIVDGLQALGATEFLAEGQRNTRLFSDYRSSGV